MNNVVIKVENLAKQYRLGQVGTGTISRDMNRWWARVRGKEDPYLKIGEVNDRSIKGVSDLVWVLKDINFEVRQGEVLGIIGKNGAGKSTLLKILSRVVSPTVGDVKIKGRIASLLEVGTGFHPDLTGRENVFLNGAILGMSKQEIKSKFDEIVDFSGVERYIDTPVKRYSSGMYVRLAFAVAAHLETEILIIDEVLAVGDAEFQKKCLGKMKDVSGHGRTVLFVSHNMPAIRSLCTKALLLKNGILTNSGNTEDIIIDYLAPVKSSDVKKIFQDEVPSALSLYSTGEAKILKAVVLNIAGKPVTSLKFREKFQIKLVLKVNKSIENISIMAGVISRFGEEVLFSCSKDEMYSYVNLNEGTYDIFISQNINLMPNYYSLYFGIYYFNSGSAIDHVENFYDFVVEKETEDGKFEYPWDTVHGYVEPISNWKINKIN